MTKRNTDNWKDGDVRDLECETHFDTYKYPQMGGYCAKSTVCINKVSGGPDLGPGCFDAEVWHDGEWPFNDSDGRSPASLHHCSAEQFVDFGLFVLEALVKYQSTPDQAGLVRVDRRWRTAVVARLLSLPVTEEVP